MFRNSLIIKNNFIYSKTIKTCTRFNLRVLNSLPYILLFFSQFLFKRGSQHSGNECVLNREAVTSAFNGSK